MKRNLKKIMAVVLAVIMIMSLIPTMASAKEAKTYGKIDGLEVRERVVLSIGETYNIKKPKNANRLNAHAQAFENPFVEPIYEEYGDYSVATKILAKSEGVDLVYVVAYNDLYDNEGNWYDFEYVEEYWIIVVVKPYGKTVKDMGKVTGVYMDDVTVNCKDDFYLFPEVETYNDDAYYCTYFVSDYEAPVYVWSDGSFSADETGSTNATCYVIDAQGNIFSDDFTFTVKYSFGQWIVHYLLFGWLWDIISGFIYF